MSYLIKSVFFVECVPLEIVVIFNVASGWNSLPTSGLGIMQFRNDRM